MTTINDPFVILHKVMADAFDVEDLQANGNAEIMVASLSDEQLEIMRQMLAECAGLKE